MDKAERDRIREAVRRPDRTPFFVYTPARGRIFSSPKLEFVRTEQQQLERVRELKSEKAAVFVRGVLQKHEDKVVFCCENDPPAVFLKDLKRMARTIPVLEDCLVTKGDDIEALVHDASKRVGASLARETADDDANERVGRSDEVPPEVRRILDALAEVGPKVQQTEQDLRQFDRLKAYGKEVFTALDDARSRARQAAQEHTGPLPEELIHQEMAQAWGGIGVLYREASKAVAAATEAAAAAVEAREKAKGRSSFQRLGRRVEQAVAATKEAREAVAKLTEAIQRFERRAADLTGVVPADGGVRVAPAEDEPLDAQPSPERRLRKLHAIHARLAANPLIAELVEKAPLAADVRQLPVDPDDFDGASEDDVRRHVMRLVFTSRLPASSIQVRGVRDTAGLRALLEQLTAGGTRGTAEVTSALQEAQAFWNDLRRAYGEQAADAYKEAVRAAGLEVLDLTAVRTLAKLDAWGLEGPGGTIRDDDGRTSEVRIPESGKVAVAGGGPIGLMAAIEVALRGSKVVVFEGRPSEYSRRNILTLDPPTVERLARYGLADKLFDPGWATGTAGTKLPVRKLETALMERAVALGVRYEKGKGVKAIDVDDDTGECVLTVTGTDVKERANLLVVAVGSGIANKQKHAGNVVMAEQLGIRISTFGLEDHALTGIFDKKKKRDDAPEKLRKRPVEEQGAWSVTLEHGSEKYLLMQLTEEEYRRVENDRAALETLVRERGDAIPNLKDIELDDVGRFKIVIQRADRFTAKGKPAVIVGDAVATPHPQTGSGANRGAMEIDVVGDLVRDLVLAARRRGGRKQAKKEAFEAYDAQMEGFAQDATKKGVGAMLDLRRKRALNVAQELSRVRDAALKAGGRRKAALDRLMKRFVDNSRTGELLRNLATRGVDEGEKGWKTSEQAGRILEQIEESLTALLGAAKQQFEEDPTGVEDLIREGLEQIERLAE